MSTNAGGKLFICVTPKPTNLSQAAYEALTWVEIGGVGTLPESGINTNLVSYPTINQDVTQKGKGASDAGDGTIEVRRIATDPGQVALRAAALTKFDYAFKREIPDAPDELHSNTIYYNRGIVTGPLHSGGGLEDFVLETFQVGFNQREIVVNPEEL